MPTGETLKDAVNRLLFPAVNVLRGIELDLADHPECPFRVMAVKATANLMTLLELAQKESKTPEVSPE
jgi:hypothetical protein